MFVKKGGSLAESDNALAEARELHRPFRKKFVKRRIVTLSIDDLWAADLIIMTKYASENDNYKYMLNVIDTFSKYAWSEPLLQKSGLYVVKAFKKILRRARTVGHSAPSLLHCDKGREFVNKDFNRCLQEYNIKMYHTENEEKSAIVERLQRSLNERMKIRFEVRKSFRWVDTLQDVLDEYNHSYHRTIKMEPAEVNLQNESKLRNMYANLEQPTTTNPKFKIGDRVRITIKKDVFANKYRRNWTREIFTVSKILKTSPVTYRITDRSGEEILGSFYEQELQKTFILKNLP